MALGPKQMGEAIIRNLKEKTGKTLEQWIELIEQETLQDKKEIIAFLKTENGIGRCSNILTERINTKIPQISLIVFSTQKSPGNFMNLPNPKF